MLFDRPERSTGYCPYYGRPIQVPSEDHIFPQFLGGHATVACEKSANSAFGHSFEARAATQLQAMQVYIASWGLSATAVDTSWRNAHQDGKRGYHFALREGRVKPELARPIIARDEDGAIVGGIARSRKEAERFASDLKRKGLASEVLVEAEAPVVVDSRGLATELILGPDLARLSLKMVMALAQRAFGYADGRVPEEAARFLFSNDPISEDGPVRPAYWLYPEVEVLGHPLRHLILVSQSETEISGIVRFFGAFQYYCRLDLRMPGSMRAACLGLLDPVSGEESFHSVSPIALAPPPFSYPLTLVQTCVAMWSEKLAYEALLRGATHPPELRLNLSIS